MNPGPEAESPQPCSPAERGFLSLAREWQAAAALAGPSHCLDPEVDRLALACLLLSRERNPQLGAAAKVLIEANYELRKGTLFEGCDSRIWEICAVGFHRVPKDSTRLYGLTYLMRHPNSGLRIWGMHMGWLVREWLSPKPVVPILLENVAGTLGGYTLALGLAATFFPSDAAFFAATDRFTPSHGFEAQYARRLAQAKDIGVAVQQCGFLVMETAVRKLIEDRCL